MLPTIARIAVFIATISVILGCQGDTSVPSEMWLEIPEMNGRVEANGFAELQALPQNGLSSLRLHLSAKQSGDISYGAVHTKINTEAADSVTTKRSTSDGVLCDFDLRHWGGGFNLQPGRNSVEVYYSDRYQRIHYASFLMQFGGQTSTPAQRAKTGPPERAPGEKYAVIIGISKYSDSKIPQLKYARTDAESIVAFLKSPAGGGFPADKDHLLVLLDEEATRQKLESAFRTFLAQPEPEDLVVIYYAGHGVEDKKHGPGNFYLLTYDTKSDDYGGTAYPMEDLGGIFGRVIKAQHVISFVDSCNSFGISGARSKSIGGEAQTGQYDLSNQYLLRYAAGTKKSFAIITASDVGESSLEGQQYGGGHGVFSYYLLEGLKGAARSNPKSSAVTAGNLFDYVHKQVAEATHNQQNPQAIPGLAENLLLSGAEAWRGAQIVGGETRAGLRH
jgi:hypothetical protein